MTSARLPMPSLDDIEPATDDESDDAPLGRVRERARLATAAAMPSRNGQERVALRVPRNTDYLSLVRKVVSDLATRAGFRSSDVDKIELAVDEACSNAMMYQVDGCGEGRFDQIELEVAIEAPRFTVVLRDRGDRYAFEEKGNFDLEDHLRRVEPGGLGIYIIKNFMDEVLYEHTRSGNVLTMVKFLKS